MTRSSNAFTRKERAPSLRIAANFRTWLHVSGNDNGANTSAVGMRNWIIANNRMADALKAKGYPYQYVFSEASGHVDRRVQLQTMPEAFEWVWKGYKPSGRSHDPKRRAVQ